MSDPLLSIRGVHTFYGHIEALRGIDLEIHPGEIVTLIGANGDGKSTLLMTICGNPRARLGEIRFEGENITSMPTFETLRPHTAHSTAGRSIIPPMTVIDKPTVGANPR